MKAGRCPFLAIVAGIVAALGDDCRYEVFNLRNSHPVRLTELIAAIEGAVGKPAAIVHHPEQPGDVPITYADISKAERLLGYGPATSFATGLAKQVAWYREQAGRRRPRATPKKPLSEKRELKFAPAR